MCIDKIDLEKHASNNHIVSIHTEAWSEASSNVLYRYDKINCTTSVDRFMRLVCWGDNPNKKTPIYIMSPLTECIQPELPSNSGLREQLYKYREVCQVPKSCRQVRGSKYKW